MAGLQAHPVPSREVMREALNIRHGEDLQNKICAARVAVCGLGGLGSNIAIALARAGVGHLHLIDFDRVDLTNLNRRGAAGAVQDRRPAGDPIPRLPLLRRDLRHHPGHGGKSAGPTQNRGLYLRSVRPG